MSSAEHTPRRPVERAVVMGGTGGDGLVGGVLKSVGNTLSLRRERGR